MNRHGCSRRWKYGKYIEVFPLLISAGANRAPDGPFMNPTAIKNFETHFLTSLALPGESLSVKITTAR